MKNEITKKKSRAIAKAITLTIIRIYSAHSCEEYFPTGLMFLLNL